MAEKKEYWIKVQGQLVPVTKEIYLVYYRMDRRERHLEEKDRAHGVFSIMPWIQRKPLVRIQSPTLILPMWRT